MKYDVIIIGAGPGGIFAAYEFQKKCPSLSVGVFETGTTLAKRRCPIDGEKVKNDHIFFHLASTLRKFQQRLSRLSPDTKMYGRIQTRINHLYEKIRNHRRNNLETISAHIV